MEKIVDLYIAEFAAVQGRDGPQWKMTCAVPWSKPEYKKTFYTTREEGSAPPAAATYRCRLGRSADVYTKKDGTPGGDGSHAYDYNWYMNEFGMDTEAVSARDVPTATPAPDHSEGAKREAVTPLRLPSGTPPPFDPIQHSIWQSVVFQGAIQLAKALEYPAPQECLSFICEVTGSPGENLWDVLQGIGNTPQDATGAPQANGQPATASETPKLAHTPVNAKQEFVDTVKEHGWSREFVTKTLGMPVDEYVDRAPSNGQRVDWWRSATASCMEAWSQSGQALKDDIDAEQGADMAENEQAVEEESLPW